jgi:hypothetical protein
VIATDADAVWLSNPLTFVAEETQGAHIVAQRGRYSRETATAQVLLPPLFFLLALWPLTTSFHIHSWPKYLTMARWGSTLCMGFAFFRASDVAQLVLDVALRLLSETRVLNDDQVIVNAALDLLSGQDDFLSRISPTTGLPPPRRDVEPPGKYWQWLTARESCRSQWPRELHLCYWQSTTAAVARVAPHSRVLLRTAYNLTEELVVAWLPSNLFARECPDAPVAEWPHRPLVAHCFDRTQSLSKASRNTLLPLILLPALAYSQIARFIPLLQDMQLTKLGLMDADKYHAAALPGREGGGSATTFRAWLLSTTGLPDKLSDRDAVCEAVQRRFLSAEEARHLSQEGKPLLLLSMPGSGNTFLRLLLEYTTGIFTGSLTNDKTLKVRSTSPRLGSHFDMTSKAHVSLPQTLKH